MNNPLLIFLLIIFSAVLYATLIAPQIGIIQGRYEHLQDLSTIISQGEDLQRQRDALQAQRNSIATVTRELLENAKRPYTSEEVVAFVISLNTLLVQSSLGGSQPYTVGSEERQGDTVVVPITFSFSNIEYDLLLRFLEQLSQWDRGARIASVRISAPQTGAGSDTAVQSTVVIEALFSADDL